MTSTKVIAHRGNRSNFPENTLISIKSALGLDISGIEFDVELTKDSKFVVLHQETLKLNRSSLIHADRSPATNWVNSLTLNEIKNIDAGSWFDEKFKDEKTPSLDEVLSLDWKDKEIHIELKDPYYWNARNLEYEKRVVEKIIPYIESLEKRNKKFFILSFNEFILIELRKLFSDLNIVWNLWVNSQDKKEEVIKTAKENSFNVIQLADSMVLEDITWVKDIHNKNIKCSVYNVSPTYSEKEFKSWDFENYKENFDKLVALGVGYIISDFPSEASCYLKNTEISRHN